MADTATFSYRAFLSYSHRDQAWATWLHAELERYRIGNDLVGRATPAGPVPRRLRPIFRDRDDFAAGHSLTEQTLAALEASQFLIVICSPHAAQSRYVEEEIRRFKMLGRGDRIIPVIVEGEPSECFPDALRVKLGPDGMPTSEREEPLAADARPQGDGKELAKQKVVAGLLGVGLDEIVRRAEQARRRRNHIWAGLAGMFMALAIAASGSAVYARHQLKTNEAFLNATLKRATEIVNEAVAQAEKYNVPRGATLALLTRAEGLFDDMAQYGQPTPELRYRKASMLIHFARNYEILGDTRRQLARATEAHRLLAELAAEKADDTAYQRDLSVALNELGIVLQAQGRLVEALASYRAGLDIAERLTAADPGNNGWLHDLLVSHDRVGDVLFNQGNLNEALAHYRASLAAGVRLTAAEPANAFYQRSLSMAHNKVGDVLVEQGGLEEALASHRASLAIRQRFAAAEPGNASWQRDLSVAFDKVGDVLQAQGKFDEAYESYRAGLVIAERLATTDPSHSGWQRDLSVSHNKIGDVLTEQRKLDEALASYRAGHAIRARLAAGDPGNEGWQRDLSLSHEKVGDALRAQGKIDEALASYRAGLAIRERLAAADPSNAGWQHDLSVAHNKIGEVMRDAGRLDEALASYRADVAIAKRLAASDPSNASWQRDLAVSRGKLALTFRAMGKPTEALDELRAGRQIMAALVEKAPGYVQWANLLAAFDHEIAEVERQIETARQ